MFRDTQLNILLSIVNKMVMCGRLKQVFQSSRQRLLSLKPFLPLNFTTLTLHTLGQV